MKPAPASAPEAARGASDEGDRDAHHRELFRSLSERYRDLIDLSPDAILVRDGARVVLANPAAVELFGVRDVSELLGKDSVELFDATCEPVIRERLARLAQGERVPPRESRVLRADGGIRDVEVVGAGMPGPGGVAVLLVIRDITERKRAEAALRESEARAWARASELETVLDTVPAAVWIARDPRGDRIDANRLGAELLRRRRGENVSVTSPHGDAPRNFAPQCDGRPVAPDDLPIQRAARRGEEIRGAELELAFDDGEVLHLLGNAAPLRDERGQVKGSVGAFIDVTGLKAAEAALRDADRRKDRFLALLSHELRNPLAPIRNSLHVLDRAPPDSPAAVRAREVLQRQTGQLARLVDDLLDITRITHGKIELRPERLDAREVARRAALDAGALFEQRDVELLLSEPPEPLWVEADAARLSQMIGNLLHNALKFTPPRGQVRLKVARQGAGCEVSVRDTGIGLEPEELERIFDPFVQAERRAPGQGGLGLGLALVRELAAKHGGSVHARSDGPGQGAEFVIAIPLAAPPAGRAERPPGPAGGPRLRVLVVEDNADAAATLGDLLELAGHEVRLACNGRAALEAFAAAVPDVVICDIGLPDLSGHDVIRALRAAERTRRAYAIALTGYAQPQDRAEALAAGFDAHLAKPPPLDELQALLGGMAASLALAGRSPAPASPAAGSPAPPPGSG